jgi:hypothetical protein
MLKYVDDVFCGLCIYICITVFLFFVLSFFFLFSSALIPVAGVTFCVYWSVSQQRPVEITLWAVLIYLFCKLFFVVVTVWYSVILNFRCYFFVLIELYGILIVIVFCV